MKKAYELEPNAKWIPGEKHSYHSKRKNLEDGRGFITKSKKYLVDSEDIVEAENIDNENNRNVKRRRTIPKLDLPLSNGTVFTSSSGNPIINELKNKE